MSEAPPRQAVVVGLFVAVGVVLLAGGILTIGNLRNTFTRKVAVTVVFDQVGGLQTGDNVWFSGMKVGTVQSLAFHGGSDIEVGLTIDREAAQYIPKDVLAKVGSDGLIGNRIVVLYDEPQGGPVAEDGDVLQAGKAISTEEQHDGDAAGEQRQPAGHHDAARRAATCG